MTSVKLTKAQEALLLKINGGDQIFRHYTESRQGNGRFARVTVKYQYRAGSKAITPATFKALEDAGYLTQLNRPASIFQPTRYAISAVGKARAAGEEA